MIMSVFRIEKNYNYTTMSNYHLRDKNLSYKAKGLLSFMLSLPDDWDYSITGLVAISKEGFKAVKNILQELQNYGYLVIEKKQNKIGQFEYEYMIYEYPGYQKGEVDKGEVEKGIQINTNKQNTKKINTPYNPPKGGGEDLEEKFKKFWEEYPKKVSKGNAEKWFKKHKPTNELVDLMIEKIKQLKETEQWKKDKGQFIPYPATWLNAKGWEDEILETKPKYDTETIFYNEYIGKYKLDENGRRIFV